MDYREILQTTDAKKNFIKGLVRLAKADSAISAEEAQYFESAARSLGLDNAQMTEVSACIQSDRPIEVQLVSMEEKLLLFREGIQLCAIDEAYEESEKVEVRRMAHELGVTEELIQRIESWVDAGMKWRAKGDSLLHA